MAAPPPPAPLFKVAELFSDLAELDEAGRESRLAQLAINAPDAAARLRSLFSAEAAAGDFLSLLEAEGLQQAPNGSEISDSSTGGLVGPYRLDRLLGKGGMGTVWLADDERLGRKVALKVFTGPRDRMLDEARAAARLDHPNVAPVYDIGETDEGLSYIAMSWCRGGSLAERLQRGPLAPDQALLMAAQVSAALEEAHRHGIIHRDVKPGNVLFDHYGQARLADFGIATLPDGSGSNSGPVGTLPYMAPELLAGQPASRESDLWSLGVTLYEALAGRRPFDGDSRASLLYQILAGVPQPLGIGVRLPELDRVILGGLLEKSPASRTREAGELKDTLFRMRSRLESRSRITRPPVPMSPLIGRKKELSTAGELLKSHRLITLTGPGGTGKTRLALEIALRNESLFESGTCFVGLAAVPASELIPNAVANALGLQERGAAGIMEQLLTFCMHSELLLVLDTCEHLPGAGILAASLLAQAPGLRILATSRAPLRVEGEQTFPVSPMQLPNTNGNLDSLRQSEAVRLFSQRASAADPHFGMTDPDLLTVADICRRLDGLPLAIELAASRVKMLGVSALHARLERSTDWLRSGRQDRPERHQTLRNAIEWSYALLNPREQRLFCCLAAFAGGFNEDAPVAILGMSDKPEQAAEMLESLVERSLVASRPGVGGLPRFYMLDTIRELATELLHASGEESEVRRRHATLYLSTALAESAQLRGSEQVFWHARLREDESNLRSALESMIWSGDHSGAARLAVALERYWIVSCSFVRETMTLLNELEHRLSRDPLVEPALHAKLVLLLGALSGIQGDHASVPHSYYQAGLEICRSAGNPKGEARALNHLGWSSLLLGRLEDSEKYSVEALTVCRRENDAPGAATSLINLGWVFLSRTSFPEAEEYFTEALAIQHRLGDGRSIAYATGHLATAAFHRGDAARAVQLYEETDEYLKSLNDLVALPTFQIRRAMAVHMGMLGEIDPARLEKDALIPLRQAGHAWSLGYALAVLGRLWLDRKEFTKAEATLAESLEVRRAGGLRSGVVESEALLAELSVALGDRKTAGKLIRSSLRGRIGIGERLGIIESCEACAGWAMGGGNAGLCLTLLSGSAAARDFLDAAILPRFRPERMALENQAIEKLGPETSVRIRKNGAALALEQIASLALESLPT